MSQLNHTQYIDTFWDEHAIPTLQAFIKIPNKSPDFDKNWQQHGYMQQACDLLVNFCEQHQLPNMQIEVIQKDDLTPLIFIEIAGQIEDTILLYGHFDKQPEMQGWHADLGPWQPVIKDDKLYGRGGADDGYAVFAALSAIKSLQAQNIPHARCIIIIEGSEESGSRDLPVYIDELADRIGKPSLVICLDSGCGNYEQLWATTSLRGLLDGDLTVNVLTEGVHSGAGSGLVPSTFRVIRQVLDRLENAATGKLLPEKLHAPIPTLRIEQATKAAEILGDTVYTSLPIAGNLEPDTTDLAELILRKTWRPTLSITGIDGLPPLVDAGNVIIPTVTLKLSIRLPPTTKASDAISAVKNCLEENPPQNADVTFELGACKPGWNAPLEADWLIKAANDASITYFKKPAAYTGEGGSIPFMGMLGEKFPAAQFFITGVLGPHSNAHGPNEFLHLPMAKKVSACVAHIIAQHYIFNTT